MNDKDRNRLVDMRRAAIRAIEFVEEKSRDDLEKDNELLGFAVVLAIEIVGEAASKVDLETRKDLPEIQWHNIIGMRNRIIHDYGNVNYDIVWQVITNNLPDLIIQLNEISNDKSND